MDVRYWIYWNDLVQGPFTLDELAGLKAFDEDLLVCLEDRDEWIPAAHVADLAPDLERLRIRQNRLPPPPPPPPPDRPPRATPLQGEFFGDVPGQRTLFDKPNDKDSTPYAFAPAWQEIPFAETTDLPSYTNPFHFGVGEHASPLRIASSVLPKSSLSVMDPPVKDKRPSNGIDVRKVSFAPPTPVKESPMRQPMDDEFVPFEIPLRIFPKEDVVESAAAEKPKFEWPNDSLLNPDERRSYGLVWAVASIVLLIFLGYGIYRLIDHISSRAAIAEAGHPLLPKPIPAVPIALLSGVDPPWAHLENKAISLVMNHRIGSASIRRQAQEMLKSFHQKELLHAAADGERLYLPDRMAWSAQAGNGSVYHVHLNLLSAPKEDGTQVESPSNSFSTDLAHRTVTPEDGSGLENFFARSAKSPVSPRDVQAAAELEAVLSAAHTWTQKKIADDAMLKKSSDAVTTRKADDAADAARTHFQHTIERFRVTHAEKTLQNLAKAYPFLQMALNTGITSTVSTEAHAAVPTPAVDRWAHKESQAVEKAKNSATKSGLTVQQRADQMLKDMGEKEILYAAATGERQWAADQTIWTASGVEGPLYRVRVDFVSTAAGTTTAALKSDLFDVDLKSGSVSPADKATREDFAKIAGRRKNSLATACGAVISAAVGASATSVPKAFSDAVSDFRLHYSEQTLQNLGRAYPPVRDALAALSASKATWAHQENQATAAVQNFVTPNGQTVSQRVTTMLKAMRNKELTNAAETGQRSYLPDDLSWNAAVVDGSTYHVRLDWSAVGLDGNRITAKSDTFNVDLQNGSVKSADRTTLDDFFKSTKSPPHKDTLADVCGTVVDAATATRDSSASNDSFAEAVKEFRARFPEQKLQNLATAFPAVAHALSGLADAAVVRTTAESASKATPASIPMLTPAAVPAAAAIDAWSGKENEAIKAVMNFKTGGAQTVGARAKLMLEEMHEKELLQAADTGERLYLPDKASWSALHEEGDAYRVYLNFSAVQATGDRTAARMYPFRIHLTTLAVDSDDSTTSQDFIQTKVAFKHLHTVMADDIESILGGVDEINKLMLRTMIIKKTRHNKKEILTTQNTLTAAQLRLQKAMAYFRTRYPEKALGNIGHAYNFKVS